MGTSSKTKEKVEYPIYKMEEKGKLILPPHILSQITFLHSHCGTDEWSGFLLYDVIKGNPSKPEGFELEVKHIFLMDIGSAAYTEYQPDGDIVDLYDQIPEAMEQKLGHIHTHHSGGTYFSGTDMDELHTNVDKHNYYLSLIVNFNGNYAAKVVFLSDMHTTSKMNFVNDAGVLKHFKQSKVEKHMVEIEMRIFFEGLGGFFSDRLKQVNEKIEAAKKAAASRKQSWGGGHHVGGYGGHHNSHFHNQNMNGLPAHNQRMIGSKIIPDKMTSWEIEKLAKNILMFDTELKTESNVYAILHQILKQEEAQMDLFYDYLLNHIDNVIDAYFDNLLADDERIIVIKEVVMCIKKFEGVTALTDLVGNLEETFDHFILGYEVEDVSDEGERNLANRDIADQLEQAERELNP